MDVNTSGFCPHCTSSYDARSASVAFPGKISGKTIQFIFALCPSCIDLFNQASSDEKKSIVIKSVENLAGNPHGDWTITTSLALHFHGDDFFNAWWYGIDMPREVIDATNDGLVDEITIIPPVIGAVLCINKS